MQSLVDQIEIRLKSFLFINEKEFLKHSILFCYLFLFVVSFQMKQITYTVLAIFLIIECSCIQNVWSRKLISSTIRTTTTESPTQPPTFHAQQQFNSNPTIKTWVLFLESFHLILRCSHWHLKWFEFVTLLNKNHEIICVFFFSFSFSFLIIYLDA